MVGVNSLDVRLESLVRVQQPRKMFVRPSRHSTPPLFTFTLLRFQLGCIIFTLFAHSMQSLRLHRIIHFQVSYTTHFYAVTLCDGTSNPPTMISCFHTIYDRNIIVLVYYLSLVLSLSSHVFALISNILFSLSTSIHFMTF